MPNSMIEIDGLVKKYGDRVAVNGVSFCVQYVISFYTDCRAAQYSRLECR